MPTASLTKAALISLQEYIRTCHSAARLHRTSKTPNSIKPLPLSQLIHTRLPHCFTIEGCHSWTFPTSRLWRAAPPSSSLDFSSSPLRRVHRRKPSGHPFPRATEGAGPPHVSPGLNPRSPPDNPEQAVDNFRGALAYDRSNDQYQLNLARALRDTGRTDESRAYLLSLWERKPEDSTINLALARLAARENSSDGRAPLLSQRHLRGLARRRRQPNAATRNSSWSIFCSATTPFPRPRRNSSPCHRALPTDAEYHLRLGKLFSRAQDYRTRPGPVSAGVALRS